MDLGEFKLVADNGYRRRTPPVAWDPVVIPGGLLGVPKKPVDFTNPYHPQNQTFYDPVICGAPDDVFVVQADTQTLQDFPSFSRGEAFDKLELALQEVERVNERVDLLIGDARNLLDPSP